MKMIKIKQYCCLVIHTLLYWIRIKPCNHYDIVIVRSDAIGDFVIWMSTLSSYKRKYKGKSMLLICPTPDLDLALATRCFDKVLTFDRKAIEEKIFYHVKYMYSLKRISANTVLNPTWQHQMSADYICAMINAKHKIGTKVNRKGIRNKLCNLYFTDLIDMPDLQTASEFEAIQVFTKTVIDPNYHYSLSDVSNIVGAYVSPIKNRYCCISISSSQEKKNWPIERVSELIRYIPENINIVLLGYGSDDEKKALFIIQSDNGNHVFYNYVNKTSVLEMLFVISRASFVLGNDSVAIHMAAACRVRSLCYMHGAHYKRFVPYPSFILEKEYHPLCVYCYMDCFGCGYDCIFDKDYTRPLYCLRAVSVDMVKEKLRSLINQLGD